jgi:hypothetical protein
MGAYWRHDESDFAAQLERAAVALRPKAAAVVRDTAREGNAIAKANAERTSGTHGKHFPKAFTASRLSLLAWQYGPLRERLQGNMNFEEGPGPQTTPHRAVGKSFDVIKPRFHQAADKLVDELFRG